MNDNSEEESSEEMDETSDENDEPIWEDMFNVYLQTEERYYEISDAHIKNGMDEEKAGKAAKREMFDINTKHLKNSFIRVLVVAHNLYQPI